MRWLAESDYEKKCEEPVVRSYRVRRPRCAAILTSGMHNRMLFCQILRLMGDRWANTEPPLYGVSRTGQSTWRPLSFQVLK